MLTVHKLTAQNNRSSMNATRVTVSDDMLSVQASKFPARTVQSLVQQTHKQSTRINTSNRCDKKVVVNKDSNNSVPIP